MQVKQERFGEVDGNTVYSFTIKNERGVELTCINYGCIITEMIVPDLQGNFENVFLGYDTLEEYLNDTTYLGAIIGRVGGRIKGAQFKLDGQSHTLAKNEGNNHLHGGIKGFNRVIWDAEVFEQENEAGVQFKYLSPDGEEGYSGNVAIKVTYSLNNENELVITYNAVSDKKTPIALTNHSYFNLSGNLKRDILNHTLKLKSDRFLELDQEFIPTGAMLDVRNTPFDFTEERTIKSGTVSNHPQNVLVGKGYDHPFLLSNNHDEEIVLKDPESGRTLIVETDEVGVVVYSGNLIGDKGYIRDIPARKHLGICLETQGLPDAIHHPAFPSIIIDKDQKYSSATRYKFGVER
ncbi:galactose mutarotase [Oceanobacillus caeni]|uniref:aldose epimerase family protein n=1 Tax=Oceanobacillus caeni TaxID=405946 RepID=UPI001C24001C|nr:aldose epimerase family protein [Oceanobacillus caeni]MBU8791313.1 galactose mutarotase [Oceanobacillus caeni]